MDSIEAAIGHLSVRDVFALRRISDEQLVNLAGIGRGEGWAGNISIDPYREALIANAMEGNGVVRHKGDSMRIFGPYWADEAAIVMVGDFVIVMGGSGVTAHSDETLMETAGDVGWSVGDVSAEKRLADELELTKAALTIASLPATTLDGFLADLADAAIEALACEFGAVVLQCPDPRLILAPAGWQPNASNELVLGSLLQLMAETELDAPVVAQDLSEEQGRVSPLGFEEGLVSRCIIPLLGPEVAGAIVVAHAISSPRGFTSLCRQVAASIGDQASRVLTSSFAGRIEHDPALAADGQER